MQKTELKEKLKEFDVLVITEDQFEILKEFSNLIIEENTLISDYIRIFKFQDMFVFQEKTSKGEIETPGEKDKGVEMVLSYLSENKIFPL